MNCDIEYQAWRVLETLDPHPEIEERKRRIVARTLAHIAQATDQKQADGMSEVRRLEREYGDLLPWLPRVEPLEESVE